MNVLYTILSINVKQKGVLTNEIYISCGFPQKMKADIKSFFPDLACCEAEGDTLDDAIDNANEAAYNWIYAEVMEDEMDLPAISDESDLDLLEGDIVRNIQVNIRMYDGWDE